MRSLWVAVLAALVPTIAVAQFRLQDAQPITSKLLKAGRFLDVRTGRYMTNQGILTDGERIKEVGPWEQVQSHAPKDVMLIDLTRATLLPGLIDSHSHLLVSMATGMLVASQARLIGSYLGRRRRDSVIFYRCSASIDGEARRDLVIQASGGSRERQRMGSFGSVLSGRDRDRRRRRA